MASLERRVSSADCTAGGVAAPSVTGEVESVGWPGKRRACPYTSSAVDSPESSLGAGVCTPLVRWAAAQPSPHGGEKNGGLGQGWPAAVP
jgi:hypothetical protein